MINQICEHHLTRKDPLFTLYMRKVLYVLFSLDVEYLWCFVLKAKSTYTGECVEFVYSLKNIFLKLLKLLLAYGVQHQPPRAGCPTRLYSRLLFLRHVVIGFILKR